MSNRGHGCSCGSQQSLCERLENILDRSPVHPRTHLLTPASNHPKPKVKSSLRCWTFSQTFLKDDAGTLNKYNWEEFLSRIWQNILYLVSVSAFTRLCRCAFVSHSPFWSLLSLPLSCVSKSLPLLDSLSCISLPLCLPVVPNSHQTFPLAALSNLCTLMAALMLPVPQSDNKSVWFHLSHALCLYVLF